jgi:hypothetical protein
MDRFRGLADDYVTTKGNLQSNTVQIQSDGGGPRLERVPGRSEQGKPWTGPPTWAAIISMYRFRGLADDYVSTK